MNKFEVSGKTVEEAITAGLAQYKLERKQVDIVVLEEGSKGFLGFGAKAARVLLVPTDTPLLRANEFLNSITQRMDIAVEIQAQEDAEGHLHVVMEGDNQGILIGHRGETLDALQYLCSLYVNRGGKEYHRVSLDTEGYRAKREQTLVALAQRMASRVARSGRRMTMEPMNPYERRVLHAALQEHPDVDTHSEGDEPNRRVVITPKKQ